MRRRIRGDLRWQPCLYFNSAMVIDSCRERSKFKRHNRISQFSWGWFNFREDRSFGYKVNFREGFSYKVYSGTRVFYLGKDTFT